MPGHISKARDRSPYKNVLLTPPPYPPPGTPGASFQLQPNYGMIILAQLQNFDLANLIDLHSVVNIRKIGLKENW